MKEQLLLGLNDFIGRASKATYAGGGGKTESCRKGFNELEYSEGDWYYRDSYAGSLRSWGQEVVWKNGKPFWNCLYGGGMTDGRMDAVFADKAFDFLKSALSSGNKETVFQPRGPKELADGDWVYHCESEGDISKFSGHEFIGYKKEIVFTHDFVGGLVIDRDK